MTIKTLAQYLQEHGGSHEAALTAMHADLGSQAALTESEKSTNIRARVIAQHLQPLAEALGVTLPTPGQRPTGDAEDALKSGVQQALTGVKGKDADLATWETVAAKAGLDVPALKAAPTPEARQALLTAWTGSLESLKATGTESAQALRLYQFAHDTGLNPSALALIKGLDGLEQRDVPGKDKDGKDITTKVWGIPKGEAFTPALDTLAPVLGSLKVTPTDTVHTPAQSAFTGVGNRTTVTAPDTNPILSALKTGTPDAGKSPSVWDSKGESA